MRKNRLKIVVMGLGYIGLPTASILATKGHQVVGVDVNENAVRTINAGKIHIVERDLDVLVRSAVNSGNLKATLTPEEGDVFILAVPTPFKVEEGQRKSPDLQYVERATRAIIPFLREGNLLILESTSPVGTTEKIKEIIADARPDLVSRKDNTMGAPKLYIAHCPERVLPGHIIRELVDNDRIIGGVDKASAEKARDLYRSFCNGNMFLTDSRTAELAKLTENAFRDVNIAFANELSLICDRLGINVWELIELANKHPRVKILQPGPGVGGHCIAVDPWFIVAAAPEETKLMRTAREVNDSKPRWVIDKVQQAVQTLCNDNAKFKTHNLSMLPTIGCLGLAFKANIDDLRESPALEITRELIASGIGRVMPCEPNISGEFREFPLYDLAQVLKESDILLVLVDHREFKDIDRVLLNDKIVIDTRGLWK